MYADTTTNHGRSTHISRCHKPAFLLEKEEWRMAVKPNIAPIWTNERVCRLKDMAGRSLEEQSVALRLTKKQVSSYLTWTIRKDMKAEARARMRDWRIEAQVSAAIAK